MPSNDPPTYGLTYPDNYISSLPTAPGARTPLLPLADFAALHLKHTLAHPPDHVLFPFLHGLEGENQAQNTFFASADRKGPAPVPPPLEIRASRLLRAGFCEGGTPPLGLLMYRRWSLLYASVFPR